MMVLGGGGSNVGSYDVGRFCPGKVTSTHQITPREPGKGRNS